MGGYGGFDRIAAAAVKKAKQQYPDITLMLVLPYHPAERPVEKPPGYDGTYYPEGLEKTSRPYAIVKATAIAIIVAGAILLQLLVIGMIVLLRTVPQNGRTEVIESTEIIEK